MSSKNNECRFCLKKMQMNERMALIDEEINDQFTSITQIQLETSNHYSQIICELCLRSLQLASAVKIQFIENQRKLQKYNEDFENDSTRSESPLVPQSSPKRRRRDIRQTRTSEDYIDPLQLVSVHESNEEYLPENRQVHDIKQENADEYESYNYEENHTSLLDNFANSSQGGEAKSNYMQLFNVPKVARKKEVGEKSFQCPHCKNFYKRRPHMLRHIEVNHMKVKFICVVPNCEQFFVRKERLKKHIEVNHADLTPEQMGAMIEKIRALKPIYGNENPETVDDNPIPSGFQEEVSIKQERIDSEQDANTGNSRDFIAGSSRDFESGNRSFMSREFDSPQNLQFGTDQEMIFRGLQLESIKRFALEKARENLMGQ